MRAAGPIGGHTFTNYLNTRRDPFRDWQRIVQIVDRLASEINLECGRPSGSAFRALLMMLVLTRGSRSLATSRWTNATALINVQAPAHNINNVGIGGARKQRFDKSTRTENAS